MAAGCFEAQQQPASRLLLLRAQRRGRRLDETSALLARDAVLVPIEPSVVAHRDVVELRAALGTDTVLRDVHCATFLESARRSFTFRHTAADPRPRWPHAPISGGC